ncbi:MAG: glycosyltransferase family 4 protein [Bacteroidota bacterium]
MLKIAYIHQYFGTTKGSWSTRPFEFGKRWVQLGHQVTIITAPYYKSDVVASKYIDRQFIEGMDVIVINSPDSNLYSKFRRIWSALRFAFSCSWLVIRGKYDVVIASSGPITVGIPGIAAKIFSKSKLVFEVRDLWPEGGVQMGLFKGKWRNKIAYWFESICYRQADTIVALSQGMCDYIMKRFPDSSIVVIPNSSDTQLFGSSKALSSDLPVHLIGKRYFIYFGSLRLMDGCNEILYGFAKIKNRHDLAMVFIGEGACRTELQDLANSLGLSEQVHFTGLLPKYDLTPWLNNAIASFVVFKPFPVLGTSSPNKLFDSFAAGLPIIQNTSGWMSALIEETFCGMNVISEDADSMANAILNLADDHAFRKQASEASLLLGQTQFNRDRLFEKYMKTVNSLVHV